VLAPGITGSKEDFLFLLPPFAAAGYRTESYDAAGQYESAGAGPEHLAAGRRWSWNLFVEDLIAVVEQGPTPVHLLGHSFQAVVAELVAVRRPDLVRSLTLLSAPPVVGDAIARARPLGAVSPFLPASLIAASIRSAVRHNVQHVPPGRQRFVTGRFALTRVDAHVASVALLRHVPDVRGALRATGIPLLLAIGQDDVWPIELHRRSAALLGAALRVYPGGHSPCETSPHALGRDMLALFEAAEHRDAAGRTGRRRLP
jgi:pimeloyl-ACP methyl ester carboxylesterase